MFDLLNEIFATMKRNKMRTFLTGFAVAWGIFMLIVLLGAGNGLQNGVMSNFAGNAMNTVNLYPDWSSLPYKGMKANRRIRFDERIVEFVRDNIPEVEHITGVIYRTPTSISYGDDYGTWQIQAVLPDAINIHYMSILKGRFLNDVDMLQRRKVVVINPAAEQTLFKGGESLGQYIDMDGIAFQVVGVYDYPLDQTFNMPVIIPLSTGKMLFDRGWGINQITFTVKNINTEKEADELIERIRGKLGTYLNFDSKDTSAVWIWNSAKQAIQTRNVFIFINIFLWVIGFASLMAGLVGVANIMLVTVKERTQEIGIRKAIGASPWSIIKMIIVEAVLITVSAGYIGILLGLGVIEIAGKLIPQSGGGANGGMGMTTMFMNPTVGLGVVFGALALLVACGLVAGLIPALRATGIRPIEAMRAD